MVKLAVFLENWPCKTRLHGSLAKPLIQDNIPPAFFLRTPMNIHCLSTGDTISIIYQLQNAAGASVLTVFKYSRSLIRIKIDCKVQNRVYELVNPVPRCFHTLFKLTTHVIFHNVPIRTHAQQN